MTGAESDESLEARATRGSLWAISGYGTQQLVRLGGNLILTRLLFAEAFGLMALVTVFMQGIRMFSDIGIGPSIIQSRRGDDPAFFATAWCLQIVRGFVLWLVACIAAHPVASFYEQRDLVWLIPLVGFTAVLGGFNSTKIFRLNRQLLLGRRVSLDIMSQLVGVAVMIAWALVHRSVLALVAGGFAQTLVLVVGSHLFLPGARDRLRWERAAAREILSFGGWVFVSTILFFFARQSDRLVLGKLLTAATLGVYSIGAQLAMMPQVAVGMLIRSVVFPLYSRILGLNRDLGPTFGRVRRIFLVVTAWIVSCMIAGGPSAISFLYDPRYHEAGWVVRLLAIGTWFSILEATYGSALLAHGRSNWTAAANAARLVGIIAFMPMGFQLFGVKGAVAGFSASGLLMYTVSASAAHRLHLRGWGEDLALSSYVALVSALGLAIEAYLLRLAIPAVGIFLAIVAVSTGAWIPPGIRAWRSFKGFGRSERDSMPEAPRPL